MVFYFRYKICHLKNTLYKCGTSAAIVSVKDIKTPISLGVQFAYAVAVRSFVVQSICIKVISNYKNCFGFIILIEKIILLYMCLYIGFRVL